MAIENHCVQTDNPKFFKCSGNDSGCYFFATDETTGAGCCSWAVTFCLNRRAQAVARETAHGQEKEER